MLEDALKARYPAGSAVNRPCLPRMLELCTWYLNAQLGEADSENRLCSRNDATYWQQLSEVFVAWKLHQHGLKPFRQKDSPDFFIEYQGKRIWIEVICPEPKGIPRYWTEWTPGIGKSIPHREITLRWTAAIKEKFEKLNGNTEQKNSGYLAKGTVSTNDGYIIAINGRRLRSIFPTLNGISQHPFVVESTLAVGPLSIEIDRDTAEKISRSLKHRPSVLNKNGASVQSDTFFNPKFKTLSAVWSLDFDENILFDRPNPSIIVHNHAAKNIIPYSLIPANLEFKAKLSNDYYTIEETKGRDC